MKSFFLLLFVLATIGCSSQKNTFNLEKLEKTKSFILTNCPDNGKCNVKFVPNKSIILKKDNFDHLYGEMEKSDEILVKISFKRNSPPNVADAYYSETYYFNIPRETKELDLTNEELQKVNLVIDRQCFCKGTAGYFKITQGNLRLHIKKNELTLSGNFSNKKLPLVFTKINEKMKLVQ